MTLGQALELARINQRPGPFVINWAIQQKSQSGEIASHGRVPRPTHPEGCWLGKGDHFVLPLHPSRTRGFAPRGPCAGALPLRPQRRASVPFRYQAGRCPATHQGAFVLPGTHDGRMHRCHKHRACLLRPPRTAFRQPSAKGRGSTPCPCGSNRSPHVMSGAVKARQRPAARNARSLP